MDYFNITPSAPALCSEQFETVPLSVAEIDFGNALIYSPSSYLLFTLFRALIFFFIPHLESLHVFVYKICIQVKRQSIFFRTYTYNAVIPNHYSCRDVSLILRAQQMIIFVTDRKVVQPSLVQIIRLK
jgi:hypothetical protein